MSDRPIPTCTRGEAEQMTEELRDAVEMFG